MINPQNRCWKDHYTQIVIESIYDSFPPDKHFVDVDGGQLVQARGCDYDEIIQDFTGKTWDQLDHQLISCHHEAPIFFSYHGFMKFLPAYLIDLLDDDTQVADRLWNTLLESISGEKIVPEKYELNDDQVVCCILAFLTPRDFPIDTCLKVSSYEEFFYNIKPKFVFSVMTGALHPSRIASIKSKIKEINSRFIKS